MFGRPEKKKIEELPEVNPQTVDGSDNLDDQGLVHENPENDKIEAE